MKKMGYRFFAYRSNLTFKDSNKPLFGYLLAKDKKSFGDVLDNMSVNDVNCISRIVDQASESARKGELHETKISLDKLLELARSKNFDADEVYKVISLEAFYYNQNQAMSVQ